MKTFRKLTEAVRKRWRDERGAMIIQAAVASIAFLALGALAVDYGLKLIARGEAQRAADAGALAGAISLAFDGSTDLTDAGPAKRNAQGFAAANSVFGEAPDVNISSDVTFVPCPEPDAVGTCVQVDVYRNQQRGNPLPALFSRLVGVSDQGVRATATAKVLTSDKTDCLRPWAVIDRWDEHDPNFPAPDPDWCGLGDGCAPPSTYGNLPPKNKNGPPSEADRYVPPSVDGKTPGTGFRASGTPNDIGRRFALKVDPNGTSLSMTSGWGLALDLPRADTQSGGGGEGAYGPNILTCNGIDIGINNPSLYTCPTEGNELTGYKEKVMWAERGCLRVQQGNAVQAGPTTKNVQELIAKDMDAVWGKKADGTVGVIDSCCSPSPRIVPVAIVDVEHYASQVRAGNNNPQVVRIANIFGFFIEGIGTFDEKTGEISITGKGKEDAVVGRLMKFSGSGRGSVNLNETASWSKMIVLVR